MSNEVQIMLGGRQYRVSNPADRHPEVQVFVLSKTGGWYWRRFPGNGERYRQILELARGKAP